MSTPPAADRRDANGRVVPGAAASASERKTHVLKQHTASLVRSIADAVVIKDDEPFFLCPPDGQIETGDGHGFGLYHHDTRFLSGYQLEIAGAVPNPLAATALSGGRAVIELTMPALELGDGRTIGKERITIRWDRALDGQRAQLRDRISIRNFDSDRVRLPLAFAFDARFDDVFTIRGLLAGDLGTLDEPVWQDDGLVFRYAGKDGIDREVRIAFGTRVETRDGAACGLWIDVPGRGEADLEVTITIHETTRPGATPIERRTASTRPGAEPGPRDSRAQDATISGGGEWPVEVETDSIALNAVLSRSLDDLLTLRGELDGQRYYSAGIPWFATLFGRDSLIAAYQTLAFDRDIAAETLRLLAGRQGTAHDDYRDEEPGKILHELRVGELARLGKIPQTPYYGSIDSTLLFLVLLARHARWSGDLGLFHELHDNVERALAWLDGDADPTGSGYVAYRSTTDQGLANQGWKDSGDAIVTADGRIAEPPIALAEVQAYAFAARREIADLFERGGDPDRAASLRSSAEDLRQRFERDFWSDDLGSYVLALQGDGAPCAVLSSNAGQTLWTGIASPERAGRIARRLGEPDMESGWGIRTLSGQATAFNPIGYHLGTVWPHDNGLIAEGFRRYGRDGDAERLFAELVEASTDFPQQRLPECFSGYARSDFGTPVRYPIACHPQAWAAGAIPHLITSILGLEADAFEHRLAVVRPTLPAFVGRLELRGLRVGDASADLAFERTAGRTTASVGRVAGDLDVVIEP
ncbi:MAG TPA: glycogen debranching N-terminal domain-containing protein [Candidatus Limnocylindrales bacterium]|nr:glycogen debranching N-terminal domain-containing protein [Candidatus Limnocylindrales bacterium]